MGYPQIIHFNRVFHYKASILGYPYFWKHPNVSINDGPWGSNPRLQDKRGHDALVKLLRRAPWIWPTTPRWGWEHNTRIKCIQQYNNEQCTYIWYILTYIWYISMYIWYIQIYSIRYLFNIMGVKTFVFSISHLLFMMCQNESCANLSPYVITLRHTQMTHPIWVERLSGGCQVCLSDLSFVCMSSMILKN